MRAPRRGNQRLGGNAAVVQAIAAHLVLLDQHHRDAELGGGRRHRQPARAGADHAQIDAHARRRPWRPSVLLLAVRGVVRPRRRRNRPASSRPRGHLAAAWAVLHLLTATGMSATSPSSTSASTSSLVTSELAWIVSLQASATFSATHAAYSAFAAMMTLSRPAPAAAKAKVAGNDTEKRGDNVGLERHAQDRRRDIDEPERKGRHQAQEQQIAQRILLEALAQLGEPRRRRARSALSPERVRAIRNRRVAPMRGADDRRQTAQQPAEQQAAGGGQNRARPAGESATTQT